MFNSLFPILSYYRGNIPVFYSVSVKLLIRLGIALSSLLNMVGMVSSVSLTLFMSYPTDRATDGEITKIRFLEVVSWLPLHSVHVLQPTILVSGELMHNYMRTIHHFKRLTKTI